MFFASQFFIKAGGVAVAFADHVVVCTELMIGVSADEMYCRELQFLITLTAILLVEVFARAFHALNVFSH